MELIVNDNLLAMVPIEIEEDDRKRNVGLPAYDPMKTPASLKVAQQHGIAKRVYLYEDHHEEGAEGEDHHDDNGPRCACCGLELKEDPLPLIPLNAGLDKLYHLGSGYALYFRFIKYTMGMLILTLLTSGIFNLITDSRSDDCTNPNTASDVVEEEAYCTQGYILTYALPNKRDDSKLLTAQAALNLAVVIIIMFFFHYLRYQFRKTEVEADDKTITPSDYTIVIEGLPIETTNKQIFEWIKTLETEIQKLKVVKIQRPFAINEYIHLTAEHNRIAKHQIAHDKGKTHAARENEEKKMQEQLKAIRRKLADLKQEGAIKKCPVAYVTFNTAQEAGFIRSKFNKPLISKALGIFVSKLVNTFDQINGVRVEVERAPEPTDINWLNLKYTEKQRHAKRFITNLITFILIAISFGIIILVNWGQNKAIDKFGKGSPTVQGLSIVASVVIVVTNTALTMAIDSLTKFEKHLTVTKYLKGVAQKIAVAQFVNTALTNLFAELILADHIEGVNRVQSMNFYGKGGLLENIFWVFITNAFLGPVLTIFDFAYFMKLFSQSKLIKQGDNNTYTQKEANLLFEGTALNMPAKYAAMIKIILMTTLYAPALPIALVFTIVGLFLSYWADKYALLRRNALPNSLDDDLTDAMVEYLEWAACTFAVGNILYMYTLRDSSYELAFNDESIIMGWVALGVSLFHIVFPMEALNTMLFPIKDEVTETVTYDHVRHEFNTDYDQEDPNTKAKAMRKLITKMASSPNKLIQTLQAGFGVKGELLEEIVDYIEEPKVDFKALDRYANLVITQQEQAEKEKASAAKAKSTTELAEVTKKTPQQSPRGKDYAVVDQDEEAKLRQNTHQASFQEPVQDQNTPFDARSEEQRFIPPHQVQYQPEAHEGKSQPAGSRQEVSRKESQQVNYEQDRSEPAGSRKESMKHKASNEAIVAQSRPQSQNQVHDVHHIEIQEKPDFSEADIKPEEAVETPDNSRRIQGVNRTIFSS